MSSLAALISFCTAFAHQFRGIPIGSDGVGCPAKLAAVSSRIQALMRAMLCAILWATMELREIELTTAMKRVGTYAPPKFSSRLRSW